MNEALTRDNRTEKQLLTFTVNDEHYGLDLMNISEIIECGDITKVPLMPEVLAGILNLRGTVIPVINLSWRLHSSPFKQTKSSRIVIIELFDGDECIKIGVTADSVNNVIQVHEDDFAAAPCFSAGIQSNYISCIYTTDDEFHTILDINNMLDVEELSDILGSEFDDVSFFSTDLAFDSQRASDIEKKYVDDYGKDELSDYITFEISNELYGIEMSRVHEIIELPAITPVPNSQTYMKGVMELRGNMVPVVDMQKRCNLQDNHGNASSILIVEVDDYLIGTNVDSVNSVIQISSGSINDAPHYSTDIDRDFVLGFATVNNRLMIVIDPDKILLPDEISTISTEEVHHD